jgi:hypothetical protein
MADLYRAYGKAALSVAGLENNLILLIALIRSIDKSDEIFSIEYKKLERKTLGALINEAKKSSAFSKESDNNLDLILKYRNWMVHHIARDTLGFILQKDGDEMLVNNLYEIDKFFHDASEMVYEKTVELSTQRGISQEYVKKLVKLAFEAQIDSNKSSQ